MYLTQHYHLLVWLVGHGMHHGVQQLHWCIKVIVFPILTPQIWHTDLQQHYLMVTVYLSWYAYSVEWYNRTIDN